MIMLVGSRAMRNYFPDARDPSASDWDHFCDTESEAGILRATHLHTKTPDIKVHKNFKYLYNASQIASPVMQYTIKVSHMFWVPNDHAPTWNKHMSDCIFYQRKGIEFDRRDYELLKPVWEEHYNTKKTNTNQTKQKFFDDAVVRKYDHDSLHLTVSYQTDPLYLYVLKPGSTVDCDWGKFSEMHHDLQIKMIREEIYVTALERLIIPSDYTYNARVAYQWALMKCITSLFKNEWSLWIVLHLDELRKPDCDYVQRHLDRKHMLVLNSNP